MSDFEIEQITEHGLTPGGSQFLAFANGVVWYRKFDDIYPGGVRMSACLTTPVKPSETAGQVVALGWAVTMVHAPAYAVFETLWCGRLRPLVEGGG